MLWVRVGVIGLAPTVSAIVSRPMNHKRGVLKRTGAAEPALVSSGVTGARLSRPAILWYPELPPRMGHSAAVLALAAAVASPA